MYRVITHNGDFHSDDVFAVATLKLLLGDVEVVRTRESEIIESGDYVVDVGTVYDPSLKRFDHHQKGGAGTRENGIPYAAFGLVWKEYGETLSGSKDIARRIDERLVQGIDGPDNGVSVTTPVYPDVQGAFVQGIVSSFNATWKEGEEDNDKRFLILSDLACEYLKRLIEVMKHGKEAEEHVEQAYREAEDKRIIVLDNAYPFQEVLSKYEEPVFVIYPNELDGWKARGIKTDPATFEYRKKLKEEWGGKRDKELQNVSGVEDAIFVHNACFLGGAKSKEGALKLAKLSL